MTFDLRDDLKLNQFDKFDEFTYRINRRYNKITGNVDLSEFINTPIQIIIPSSIKYICEYAITATCNTPSNPNCKGNKIKIVFEHTTFENTHFEICCFDGISLFECCGNTAFSTFPQKMTDNIFTVINTGNDINADLKIKNNTGVNEIREKLMIIENSMDNINNDTDTKKVLKLKSKQIKKINQLLSTIINDYI